MDAAIHRYTLEVDTQSKNFRLSAPVFQGNATLPKSISGFFASLFSSRNALFSFDKNRVLMHANLPFSWGPQPTLRQQVYRFLRKAQQCRQLLQRTAQIERLRDVDSFLDP